MANDRRLFRQPRSAAMLRANVWRTLAFGGLILFAVNATTPALAGSIESGENAYARQDYTRSAAIFVRRAELGDAQAQTYLGYMYANGRGVPQDYVAATQWLRRAAAQGFPTAQFFLGLLYDKGFGVKQDFVEAEFWLNLAAAHADARQRDYWTRIRNAVASKLTLAEVAQSQQRALEWTPIRER
jgi:uncharacterized protein